MQPKTPLDRYLAQVELTDCPGLINNTLEWILDGWGITCRPTAEHLAAAIFLEAQTQDTCVAEGTTVPEYPKQLRSIAYEILRLCGHEDGNAKHVAAP